MGVFAAKQLTKQGSFTLHPTKPQQVVLSVPQNEGEEQTETHEPPLHWPQGGHAAPSLQAHPGLDWEGCGIFVHVPLWHCHVQQLAYSVPVQPLQFSQFPNEPQP
jgi:hypothetical protein